MQIGMIQKSSMFGLQFRIAARCSCETVQQRLPAAVLLPQNSLIDHSRLITTTP